MKSYITGDSTPACQRLGSNSENQTILKMIEIQNHFSSLAQGLFQNLHRPLRETMNGGKRIKPLKYR